MWFSVELLKLRWFGISWHVFNRSECRNCCLYTIIQKIAPPTESGKYFQIWFSPDLGENGGVLSMRMQVTLDSSFARPGLVPTRGGKKEEFRDWTKGGHDTFTCGIICWKTRFCFFSLIGRETILMIWCLLISCHISITLPARSWSENGMMKTKRGFERLGFLLRLVEAPTKFNYNSLKAVLFRWRCFGRALSGFRENHKGVGMFQNCL